MNTAQDTIVQLNNYPPEKYNVLIPVTSMQVMSGLQKIIVNEVRLDPDPDGKDVYKEKSSGKLAITAVGGTKLAAAANISIIRSESETPDICQKCAQMAKTTGNAPTCGNCPHAYDVKYTVTVRVPEPSGGFRIISKSKEIDCSLEKANSSDAQFKRFLPHRASIAETKAYMRCLRAALGLAQGYTAQEIRKPFVIAHIVPNMDAPDMRKALISNSLRDMGLLFENPTSPVAAIEQKETTGGLSDAAMNYSGEEYPDGEEEDPISTESYPEDDDGQGELPWLQDEQEADGFTCADCGKTIEWTTASNGKKWSPEAIREFSQKRWGRCLCPDCQKKQPKENTRR